MVHGLNVAVHAVDHGILLEICLGHHHAQILQGLCLTREDAAQLVGGILLADVEEAGHIPRQTGEGDGHVAGGILGHAHAPGHGHVGGAGLFGRQLAHAEAGDGRVGKLLHLVGHTAEGHVHHVLDFRHITAQFDAGGAEAADLIYRKGAGDNAHEFSNDGIQPTQRSHYGLCRPAHILADGITGFFGTFGRGALDLAPRFLQGFRLAHAGLSIFSGQRHGCLFGALFNFCGIFFHSAVIQRRADRYFPVCQLISPHSPSSFFSRSCSASSSAVYRGFSRTRSRFSR